MAALTPGAELLERKFVEHPKMLCQNVASVETE
jgi:hypothetical protein